MLIKLILPGYCQTIENKYESEWGRSAWHVDSYCKKIIGCPYSLTNSWNWLPKVQNVLENKFTNIEHDLNDISA